MPDEPRLILNKEQLQALGVTHIPVAGERWTLSGSAVVSLSSTADPNADGDIDFQTVELTLVDLVVNESPIEARERKARRLWAGLAKLTERAVGGSEHVGEFGSLNRHYGA